MSAEGLKIEGEAVKAYGVSYGGNPLGSWDTATEAWDNYLQYEKLVRPVTDRDKKYRYNARYGRKEITIAELGQRAQREPWTCEICGQVVERKLGGKPVHPIQVYENCKLKKHYVGDECIAYRDLRKAREFVRAL